MKYYETLQFNFAVFHLWRLAITTLYKQSLFFIIMYIIIFIIFNTTVRMREKIERNTDAL